ncbi:putative quinol monooxygenase [Pedobacter sp. MC2016-05]|uniref:putative quinol monooxygenase n=1 Tax=Pedobacter sp. MC2016-05 TaxID=2994474 RepID=UPI002247B9C4|nr:putative quinol monooxygenase [Pedobacter sp. MC2016-05]MCX2477317.1 putative quinol monooxygenase [Pedobacter sp. MC2016-05]
MTNTFTSIAILKAKAGKRDELHSALLRLIDPTRSEKGCLTYMLFEDDANSGTFYMQEAFQDEAAFGFHTQTTHFQTFAKRMDDLMDEPIQLIKLNQVSH